MLCGTGVGFSVERQFVSKLPEIPELFESDTTIVVKDSKEGWAKSLRQVIALLYSGEVPKWDVSKVRPAGAKLKTFGGRASGPAPLVDLFNFTIRTFKEAQGRKLSSLEVHDIMCKIGEVAEKIKKLIRDSNRFKDEEILKELGDVVFYATALANIYGKGLQEVIELNIQKLDDRQKRGTLKGSGDNR